MEQTIKLKLFTFFGTSYSKRFWAWRLQKITKDVLEVLYGILLHLLPFPSAVVLTT